MNRNYNNSTPSPNAKLNNRNGKNKTNKPPLMSFSMMVDASRPEGDKSTIGTTVPIPISNQRRFGYNGLMNNRLDGHPLSAQQMGYNSRVDEIDLGDHMETDGPNLGTGGQESNSISENSPRKPFNNIEPRKIYTWVHDDVVNKCYKCREEFTFYFRKHHCRFCKRIFCHNCSSKRMHIPEFLHTKSPEDPTAHETAIAKTFNKTINALNPLNIYNYYSSGSSDSNKKMQQMAHNIQSVTKNVKDNITQNISDGINHLNKIAPTSPVASVSSNINTDLPSTSPAKNYLSHYVTGITDKTHINSQQKINSKSPSNRNKIMSGSGNVAYTANKVRVCDSCADKLEQIHRLEKDIQVFKLLNLDIMSLKIIRSVCQTWKQISNYYLSRFREIQYYLPGHKFTIDESKLLWVNRDYIIGHSLWTVQLLRSIDCEPDHIREHKLAEILYLLGKFMGSNFQIFEQESRHEQCKLDEMVSLNNSEVINIDSKPAMNDSWIEIDTEYSTRFSKSQSTSDFNNIFNELSIIDRKRSGNLNLNLKHNRPNDHRHTQRQNIQMTRSESESQSLSSRSPSVDPTRAAEEKHKFHQEMYNLVQTAIQKQDQRKATCWQLMCSRHCKPYLRPEDALSLLDHTIQSQETRKLAIRYLGLASNYELRCYLPLLVHYMRYERIENSVIGNFIIERCLVGVYSLDEDEDKDYSLDIYLINDVYWELKINLESKAYFQIYKYFLDSFCHQIPKVLLETIFKGQHLVNILDNLPKNIEEDELKSVIHSQINIDTLPYLTLPTEPYLDYYDLDFDQIHIKNSATAPVILPFVYEMDQEDQETQDQPDHRLQEKFGKRAKVSQILYKSEDVRKDHIVMKIIRLMDLILYEEEGLDLNIITYEVRPTGINSGIIEIIPDCSTMYHIKEKQKLSILNYLIEHNPDITVKDLRSRFLKSCAAYCVITYLLGIGDRHLNNIMVTKEGVMFHIDYGFILGFDPKPMTCPKMRIDPDMVDALGGVNSQYYQEFKTLSNRIFNCLRRHVNLFINLLSLLVEVDPPIENRVNFTRKILMDEIMKRFIPGENYKEAELQLGTQIETSSHTTYGQYLNDFFHYHAQENTIGSTIESTYKGTKQILSNLYGVLGTNK